MDRLAANEEDTVRLTLFRARNQKDFITFEDPISVSVTCDQGTATFGL